MTKAYPKAHGMSLEPYFTKALWKGEYPIWQDYDAWQSLGLPDLKANYQAAKVAVQKAPVQPGASKVTVAQQPDSALTKLFYGFMLGLASYVAVLKRNGILAVGKQLLEKWAALSAKKGG